ncbi:MAG TPA: response regulator transcription factor [Stenomitos sp.]
MKILMVEDDPRISQALKEALEDRQYVVDCAWDGIEALNWIEASTYDLILLDVMLPRMDGITLCKKLRELGIATPVLMLTARDTISDKVLGLDAGADDYLVKPFDLAELTARIRALSRRNSAVLPSILEWEQLTLDPNTCEVTYADQVLNLTPNEYKIIELFVRHPKQVLDRSKILDNVWGFDDPPTEEAVKVHLKDIRKKLKVAGAPPDFIQTIYGLGYRLKSF